MKRKNVNRAVVLVFCMVSVISALYIKWNIDFSGAEVLQTQEVESVVKDEVFIPEIHFLKQLVKSIFNVVTTSL
jgi:hypothetical protein